MIKAVLFDFDGVLTIDKTGSVSITNYISKVYDIPLELVRSAYYKHNRSLLYGDITHEDMWYEFCDELGKHMEYQTLIEVRNFDDFKEDLKHFLFS